MGASYTTLDLLGEPMDKSFAGVSIKCFLTQCASLYLSSIESNLFRHDLEVRMGAEKGDLFIYKSQAEHLS